MRVRNKKLDIIGHYKLKGDELPLCFVCQKPVESGKVIKGSETRVVITCHNRKLEWLMNKDCFGYAGLLTCEMTAFKHENEGEPLPFKLINFLKHL